MYEIEKVVTVGNSSSMNSSITLLASVVFPLLSFSTSEMGSGRLHFDFTGAANSSSG